MLSMNFLATLSLSLFSSLATAAATSNSTGHELPKDIIVANGTNAATCTIAHVLFYDTRDCNGDSVHEIQAGKGYHDGNVAQFNEDGRVAPISMRVDSCADYGFTLTLTQDTIHDNLPCTDTGICCVYCGNYYSAGSGYATGGSKCINIDTGYGPDSALLAYEGKNGPGNLPCRNYGNRCKFPVPPGNGMIKQ